MSNDDTQRVLLSWSSGKDSAWTLHALHQDPTVDVVGLLTSFNVEADRVAMHAVRRQLVQRQADAAGLPLHCIDLPWPCSNDDYEAAMADGLSPLEDTFGAVAFCDLFLEDIRAYRETRMAAWGYEPVFPIWRLDTAALARTMIDAGVRAVLTCVDPQQCPAEFAGRYFDHSLLAELPDSADPCGENGEFHTFVFDCPSFSRSIDVSVGERVERDGFVFADVIGTA